jgi:DNA-binding PadR family transcriptional regulator
MTEPLPPAAYIVLGMLSIGARTGYEIKRNVATSTRYFSTISPVQIYPLLKELEEAGLVRGRAEPRGRRPRRVFELTRAGRARLRAWLEEDEPPMLDMRDAGLLKLFFADAGGSGATLRLVRAIRARSERILRELHERSDPAARGVGARGAAAPLMTLRFGIAMHEAWVAECDRLERELAAERRAV